MNQHFYKKLLSFTFYYSGIIFILNKFHREKTVRFLMYHKVKYKNFEQQMAYLTNNFEVINPLSAVERIKKGVVSGKEIVITFDDGLKNTYINAYPILKKLRIPATLFLTTGYIGTSNLSWWNSISIFLGSCTIEQLKLIIPLNKKTFSSYKLAKYKRCPQKLIDVLKNCDDKTRVIIVNRITKPIHNKLENIEYDNLFISWKEVYEMSGVFNFGAHTHTHPILTKCSIHKAKNEIIKSKKIIKRKLGIVAKGFCYPNGNFNIKIINLVTSLGFEYACTTINGAMRTEGDIFTIKRIGINIDDNLNDFKLKLSPLWSLIK